MYTLKRIYHAVLLLKLAFYSQFICQTIIPEGTISGIWTKLGSPYLIEGNITVADDSSLIIQPGVLIEFQGHFSIDVHGSMMAIGSEAEPITFTINDTTYFSRKDTTSGGWNGLNFRNVLPQNDTSKIYFCKIEYCKNIEQYWPENSGGAILIENTNNLKVENSIFHKNYADWGGAIGAVNSRIIFQNNKFTKNQSRSLGGAVAADYCNIIFNNCDFEENYSSFQAGALHTWHCNLKINNSRFNSNSSKTNYGSIGSDSSEIIIDNTVFRSNYSIWGGAIGVNSSSLELIESKFIENYADHGGGLLSTMSINTLKSTVFEKNSATWGGGASISSSDLKIESCSFVKNHAEDGGALEYVADTTNFHYKYYLIISNSEFLDNQADNIIGGVKIEQINSDTSLVNILIDNSHFMNNSADHVAALRILGSFEDFVISNSIFNSNTALRWSASAAFINSCKGTLFNCLFINNRAAIGGTYSSSGGPGIGNYSEVDFMNCTFANNSAALGSALNVRGGSIANIANSIFWGNTNSAIAVTAQNNNGGLLFINYCNLQNGPDSVYLDSLSTLIWGPKNIDADPLFIDPLANDFHLSNLSPCIGHGTDSVWFPLAQLTAPKTDLDGILRPSPEGSDPDLGAYENLYGSPTHIEHTKKMEAEFALEQNYPNPFNPETKIRYSIPYGSLLGHNSTVDVKLTVFDILGREVQIIVNTKQNPGIYEITFNGRNLSSGLYFYELLAEGYRSVKKMLLIK